MSGDSLPIVSVVIPAYNSEETVRCTAESALEQTLSDIEVIVVDDGSDDSTAAAVKDLSDQRVKLVQHGQNKGRCAARNTGVENASGEYIAYLDSDDIWYPQKLEAQVRCLRNRSKEWVGVYCGADYSRVGKIKQILNDLIPRPSGMEGGVELIRDVLMWRIAIHAGSTLLIRSDARNEIGGWNTSLELSEDRGYILQLLKAGKLAYVDRDLIKINESGEPDAEIVDREWEKFMNEYSEEVSSIEAEGYDVRGAHEFMLSKFYFSEGNFKEGIRTVWGAECPHPRDYLGLGMSIRRGLF